MKAGRAGYSNSPLFALDSLRNGLTGPIYRVCVCSQLSDVTQAMTFEKYWIVVF